MANQNTANSHTRAAAYFKENPDAELTKEEMQNLFHAAPETIRHLISDLKEEGRMERVIRYRYIKDTP